MAISFGGTLYRRSSGSIIGLFVTAGVLAILFLAQQLWTATSTTSPGLFPIQFFKSPVMVMAFLAAACASTAIFTPVFFIPLYFQFVRSDSALQAGIRLLPYIVLGVGTAMANGIFMSKKPYYMPWYFFGGTMTIIGSALLYTIDESTSTAQIYGYSIILGVGGGAFMQLSFTVVQALVEKRDIPRAIGFFTFAQMGGAAVALCIANSVFLIEATRGILELEPGLPVKVIHGAISGASSRRIEGISEEVQKRAVHVIVKAMNNAYIITLSAGALTLVMSLFMKRKKLNLNRPTVAEVGN